ncbi:hypothetical protein GQ457_04G002440 [Hibiscus cannabinus]
MGGKEVLIKSVLQAVPVYAMHCFLLPITLCRAMEQIMAKFWWRNNGSNKGIHWTTWAQLTRSKNEGGIGFRNLSQFNVALLAKQCWRLVTQPNCLMAKILKARYYPQTDFLNSSLGSSPWYVWRSLWSAKGLILQGMGWRIGSGHHVNIWRDPWLPGPHGGVVRGHSINHNYTLVSDLIDAQSATWKVEVLNDIFDSDLVKQICSIPLSRTGLGDEVVWRYDGSGLYSVKSGYKLLQKEGQSGSGSYVGVPLQISRFYSSMWGVSLPSKVKINMWRVMNNFLPTFANLQTRRLSVNVCCPLCKSEAESTHHLMRDCVFVKELLGAQGIHLTILYHDAPWREWLALALTRLDSSQRHALMVTFWAVWYARNKAVHEALQPSVFNSLSFILASLKEYEMLNLKCGTRSPPIQTKWEAPLENVVKVNFDSAFSHQMLQSVSGVICRDYTGSILAACSLPHNYVRDAFMAEALACHQTVTFAWELGFTRVVLEGDSRTVIQKCQSDLIDTSLISPVIADIKLICRNFTALDFGFVRRGANAAAHTLAQEGKELGCPMYWIEEAPPRTLLVAEEERAAVVSG